MARTTMDKEPISIVPETISDEISTFGGLSSKIVSLPCLRGFPILQQGNPRHAINQGLFLTCLGLEIDHFYSILLSLF